MKKNILGAREKTCDKCNGTMFFIKVKGLGIVSQCKCGNFISVAFAVIPPFEIHENKVYEFDEKGIEIV